MKQVLVVEDESCIREIIGLVLRSRGYEVLTAANSDEAIEICKEATKPLDVLVCDAMVSLEPNQVRW